MESEAQALPPAAMDGWYRLALAVLKGTEDPEERQEWVKWGEMHLIVGEMNEARDRGHITRRVRRMGDFEGRIPWSKNKSFEGEDEHGDEGSDRRAAPGRRKGARQAGRH